MSDSNCPIYAPKILSDMWLEDYLPKLDEEIDKNNSLVDIAIDFTETEWVELSSLVSLTQFLIENVAFIGGIDVLFNFDSDLYSKNILKANVFLINSCFFQSIQSAIACSGHNIVFRISFRVNSQFLKQKTSADIISNYLLKKAHIDDSSPKVDFNTLSDKKTAISIVFYDSTPVFFDSDFFRIFFLDLNIIEDSFIIPIRFVCSKFMKKNENENENYSNCQLCSFEIEKTIKSLSSRDSILQILKNSLNVDDLGYSSSQEIIQIISMWCSELLKNVRDHGGEKSLFALRFGDWTTRKCYDTTDSSNVIQKGICYDSKANYFEKIKNKNTTKFLDIYFIDDGNGFITLQKSCSSDRFITEKQCNSLRYLHRYAMLPHSTRKDIPSSEFAQVHITGLGLISEQAISRDSYVSIKDTNILTYFTKEKLGHIANEGDNDESSKSNFNSTLISCIIPFEDLKWRENNTSKMSYVSNNFSKFLYINEFHTHIISLLNLFIFDLETKTVYELDYDEQIELVILDVSNALENFDKPTALRIINIIYHYIDKNIPSIIFGANVPEMRIIQNIINGNIRLENFPLEKKLKKTRLFCPILSPQFDLFLSGNLLKSDIKGLINAFQNNFINSNTKLLLSSWCYFKNVILPIREIDRTINFFHGRQFLDDIEKSHYINEPVYDIHGNILDSYYEVSPFLRKHNYQSKWINDILRVISRHDIDIVVVDSAETKTFVQSALDFFFIKHIKILRYNFDDIELIENREYRKKALFIFSCAFAGSQLRKIPEISYENNLEIMLVFILLDLIDYSKQYVATNWTKCDFDFLAKGNRPKKISIKNVFPNYIANVKGRLVHKKYLENKSKKVFSSFIQSHLLYDFLSQVDEVYPDHTIEHGHHYDVFIDVRKAIREHKKLSQYFSILLGQLIKFDTYTIVYSEDSELYPIISSLKYPPGQRQSFEFLPVRQISEDTFCWANIKHSYNLKNKKIIVIDEGAYTCNTLLGIVKLLVKYQPSEIKVGVVEKRLTMLSKISQLDKLKSYHSARNLLISYYCVIDINAPTWSKHDCPFCRLSLDKLKSRNTVFKEPLKFQNYEFKNHKLFRLYITKILFSGRQKCNKMLSDANTSLKTNIANVILIELMLVYYSQIIKYGLNKIAEKYIYSVFGVLDLQNKTFIFKLHIQMHKNLGYPVSRNFTKEMFRYISDNDIFWTFVDILKSENIFKHVERIINNINLTSTQNRLWRELCSIVKDKDISISLQNFYEITGINRRAHHEKFSDEIQKSDQISDSLQSRIDTLEKYLEEIGIFGPLKDVHAAIKYPKKLAIVLSNKNIITDINRNFTMSAEEIISIFYKIYPHCEDSVSIEELMRKRKNGFEMPLLCINNEVLYRLKDMLIDNKKFGLTIFDSELDENYLHIYCISPEKKYDTQYLNNAKKGPTFKSVRNYLKAYGTVLDFELKNKRFVTSVNFKVVDYAKNKDFDL